MAKAKTLGHTLGDVGDDALVKILADTSEVEMADQLGVTLGDLIVNKLVDTLANAP